jgi:hypothetical protein
LSEKLEVQSANCPLCGRNMGIVNELKEVSIQVCDSHGVFVVESQTRDTFILEGFDENMVPLKQKWYLVENFKPISLTKYREMVKLANYKRLENKRVTPNSS